MLLQKGAVGLELFRIRDIPPNQFPAMADHSEPVDQGRFGLNTAAPGIKANREEEVPFVLNIQIREQTLGRYLRKCPVTLQLIQEIASCGFPGKGRDRSRRPWRLEGLCHPRCQDQESQ